MHLARSVVLCFSSSARCTYKLRMSSNCACECACFTLYVHSMYIVHLACKLTWIHAVHMYVDVLIHTPARFKNHEKCQCQAINYDLSWFDFFAAPPLSVRQYFMQTFISVHDPYVVPFISPTIYQCALSSNHRRRRSPESGNREKHAIRTAGLGDRRSPAVGNMRERINPPKSG